MLLWGSEGLPNEFKKSLESIKNTRFYTRRTKNPQREETHKIGEFRRKFAHFFGIVFMPIFEETGSRFPEFARNLGQKTVCYTL